MNKILLPSFSAISLSLVLAGCTTTKLSYTDVKRDVKYVDQKKIDRLLCVHDTLADSDEREGVVVSVGKFLDGNVPTTTHNGPLMDHGSALFEYYLSKSIPKNKGLMISDLPLIFQKGNAGQVGLNQYGVVDKDPYTKYKSYLLDTINSRNFLKKKIAINRVGFFKVDGVFTRSDETQYKSDNENLDAKYNKEDRSSLFSYSTSKNYKVMTLTVKLTNPTNNTIVDVESFEILYDSTRKRYRVGAGYRGFGLSTSVSDSETESIHSAQDALIREAALWAMLRFYDYRHQGKIVAALKGGQCGLALRQAVK